MQNLDASTFVVLGDGLAAGMINFSLFDDDQRDSFAAVLARQLRTGFRQALVQPPGLGDAPGFPRLPVRHPFDEQTTVLDEFPPAAPFDDLSIPGMTLERAVSARPISPLIHSADPRQTAVNFLLGMPGLLQGATSLPTQLEYAVARRPTLAIVALGFTDVLDAACAADAGAIPGGDAVRTAYGRILKELTAAGAQLVVMTIPDPMDTAHFSPVESAAKVVKLLPSALKSDYGLRGNDRVTVNGLTEVGYQVIAKQTKALPPGSTLDGSIASEITRRVQELNQIIVALAGEQRAAVYDLHGLYSRLRTQGIAVGGRTLTGDFLGGFYSLNGYFPGKTGHAVIANELVDLLNHAHGADLAKVDLETVMEVDPVANYRGAEGPDHGTTAGTVAAMGAKLSGLVSMEAVATKEVMGAIQRHKYVGPPDKGSTPERWTLKLPPSMEQVLPISKAASFYGDALRAVHTSGPKDMEFGITGKLLFGGLAMLDAHLQGSVKIKFFPPVNDIAHFEVTHHELKGDDGRLSAPQFYKLPATDHQVMDSHGAVSCGDLNLITGEVTNLEYHLYFLNSALFALVAVNPALPRDPLVFPGQYGTAWARFEQRPDGRLDYTCHLTTFIPMAVLKAPTRFPLPFAGPSGSFASIPSDGTALHPHIRISTKDPEPIDPGVVVPEFPTNTILDFTASVHNTSFGDDFTLNADELGGPAAGRSHLAGRFQVQFGERFGDTVSVSVHTMPPGGLLATLEQSPLADAFGHRIPDGLMGHNETLRFPKQTYSMDDITYLDDCLDIAVGAVDVRTGKVLGLLLRRGIITTNWLLAMVRIETRTPKSTFQFRGRASFEQGVNGQMVFRYDGKLHIPFPEGFKFPAPDLKNSFIIGPDSALEPFVRWQGMWSPGAPRQAVSGSADHMTASTGEQFSYRYEISADGSRASFEYTNHAKSATFRMQGLTWVGHINSRTASSAPGESDTVSFAGFGTWTADRSGDPHIASVQVSTSKRFPYLTILIDGGRIDSVNTKPANVEDTLP
jgi:hypothetical protein